MDSISVVLADAQYLIRIGLRHLLSSSDHFTIQSEASDEEELLEEVAKKAPQVIILDYNQPDYFSSETIKRIKQLAPSTNILIISADNEKTSIYDVIESGVNSFLTKSCDEEEIFDAIKATAKGEKFFCSRILDYILEKGFAKAEEENCAPIPLTPREIQIVQLITKGLIAKEIANVLNLSTHTVYTHRKNIMKKLNLSSSSELVLYAVNNGIFSEKN